MVNSINEECTVSSNIKHDNLPQALILLGKRSDKRNSKFLNNMQIKDYPRFMMQILRYETFKHACPVHISKSINHHSSSASSSEKKLPVAETVLVCSIMPPDDSPGAPPGGGALYLSPPRPEMWTTGGMACAPPTA